MLRAPLMMLMLGVTVPAMAAPCAGFDDVDDSSPFCASVGWLKNRGVTKGCTANLYCPDAAVSRLAVAAFIQRAGDVLVPPSVVWVATAGGRFQSIQAAIDHAASVATAATPVIVHVAPGSYAEAVRLAPFVYVKGSGRDITKIVSSACTGTSANPATVTLAAQSKLQSIAAINEGGAGLLCSAIAMPASADPADTAQIIDVHAMATSTSAPVSAVRLEGPNSRVVMRNVTIHADSSTGPVRGIHATGAWVNGYDVTITVHGQTPVAAVENQGPDMFLARLDATAVAGAGTPTDAFALRGFWFRIRDSTLSAATVIGTQATGNVLFNTLVSGIVSSAQPGDVRCVQTFDLVNLAPFAC